MNRIAQFVKEHRRAAGLTQEEFAMRSGLGLAMFDYEAVPGRKDED